jgi:hypothetical protein
MTKDQPEWLSIRITIIVFTIFILEAVIVMNSLWPSEPFSPMLWLWGAAMSSLNEESQQKAVFLAAGSVIAELIAYLLVVPWQLIRCCYLRNLYGMPTMGFLRFFALLLVVTASLMLRKIYRLKGAASNAPSKPSRSGMLYALLAFVTILPFGLLGRGVHKGYYLRLSEDKARQQLGLDYSDYSYYLLRWNQVFRPGQPVLIKASFLAYQARLYDVQQVDVSWKGAWTGPSK